MKHLCLIVAFASVAAAAQAPGYAILTFKNGIQIGTRPVTAEELRASALGLTKAFQQRKPEYSRLIAVAKGMPALDRCFNLYASRITLASVEAGKLDASANAEEFLKDSIRSIEAVNQQTGVRCEMK